MNALNKLAFIPLFLFIGLTSCRPHWEVNESYTGNKTLLAANASRPDMEAIISPYRDSLDYVMNEVLCQSANEFIINRPESNLGNWASDVLLECARAQYNGTIDAAMFNTGGLRTALPTGNITRGKIFELMPFDNELVLVTLPYNEVREMLTYLAVKGGEPVSEIQLKIKDGTYNQVRIGNKELEERSYVILTNDYLSNGGDKMYFFTEGRRLNRTPLDIKVRDVVIDYCRSQGKSGKSITGIKDGRISHEN
jgi:2',3'-cyclic-nucleotide 2'-phosphodiesterase (5'-nucleotidase family)